MLTQTVLILGLLTTAADDPAGVEFFEKNVRPLLAENCYGCHSARAERLRGGLLLDTQDGWMSGGDSGAVIEPGDPEASRLVRAIRYDDRELRMPPRGKLSENEIRVLEEWIAMGAPDPRTGEVAASAEPALDIEAARSYWAFRPPAAATLPEVTDDSWARDDLDRFVLAGLEARGLSPVADASSRAWLRRVTFDLTGLPPTVEEVTAFLADESSRARERVVDRLLASERFGERWGRHWLDVARYGESTGRTRNYPYWFAWRYRDWVVGAFNEDKPYDRFLTEQIAGDLLPADDAAERDRLRIATGFLALGPKDLNERNRLQYELDNVDEQLDTLFRATQALTVGCARCHDHKFDPIPTRDYYALAGIFRSTETLIGLTSQGGGGNRVRADLLHRSEVAASAGEAEDPPAPEGSALERINGQLAALRRELRQLERTTRFREQVVARRRANGPRRAEDAEGDPGDDAGGAPHDAASQERIAAINKEIQQLQRRARQRARNQPPPPATSIMGARDREKPIDSRIYVRGEPASPGEVVPRGFPQVLGNPPDLAPPSAASGRLELARWLTAAENPLTARVLVNRLWHHLFGVGIVPTVDNFGSTGEPPSHPELLDHLAVRFMEDGWSVKRMIRALVLSRTYALSTAYDASSAEVDPDNVYLWRMRPRRLDVEELRDAILAVAGRLDLAPPEGSVVASFGGDVIGRGAVPRLDRGEDRHRSVYLPIVRDFVPEMLSTFDFAEPSMVTGRRDITTVATQALFLLNSEFVLEQSKHLARRLEVEAGARDAERVRLAYEIVLARPPSDRELERALEYLATSRVDKGPRSSPGLPSLCQALLGSAEFRYLD